MLMLAEEPRIARILASVEGLKYDELELNLKILLDSDVEAI